MILPAAQLPTMSGDGFRRGEDAFAPIEASPKGAPGPCQAPPEGGQSAQNHAHRVAAKLVCRHALIVIEELSIGIMTACAQGTVDRPGKNVKQKAGLNRAILDTGPRVVRESPVRQSGRVLCQVILLDTRRHRSSQTCPGGARVRQKALSERGHQCGCGFAATRDQAAALSMLVDGLKLSGREPAWAARLETPSRAASTVVDGGSS